MNLLSWNCRGLGNPRTVCVLGDLLKSRKPDFLFLSETISTANKIEDLRIRFGFAQCFAVNRVGNSGGLAVFWKHHVRCEVMGYSRNHIDICFLNSSNVASWRLSCFYGFPERSRRMQSWDFIRSLYNKSPLPWCISLGISMTCSIEMTKWEQFSILKVCWMAFVELLMIVCS